MSFTKMESVLQAINREFISLDDDKEAYNNEVLQKLLKIIISKMKEVDPLFASIFQKPFYGGSYYNKLRVGHPDEYDIQLLCVLPKDCKPKLTISNRPGYIWFKMDAKEHPQFSRFIDGGYMKTNKVLDWMKGVLNKALLKIASSPDRTTIVSYSSESGPALTLKIGGKFGKVDVDLTPTFVFGPDFWPIPPFRRNPSKNKKDWFIVPKKAKKTKNVENWPNPERYWRGSFQNQENELIEGKRQLKPALRLLKKTRDSLGHDVISSYALKNIALWELEKGLFKDGMSLSDAFMNLLIKYKEYLERKKIPNYWCSNDNLLDSVRSEITLINFSNELERKIKQVKNGFQENPAIIAKVILKENSAEYNKFLKNYVSGAIAGITLS